MKTNLSEAKATIENEINRTQTGHKTGQRTDGKGVVTPFPSIAGEAEKGEERVGRAGKDSQAYWKTRVKPRIIRGRPTPEFYARFFAAGRESWVCLNTSNRGEAASAARDLYLQIKAKGLDAALAEFRPQGTPRPEKSSSVYEFLAAAKGVSTVRNATFARYEICLRRLVAGVLGLTSGTHFYPKSSGATARREKINRASLDVLSAARVEAWRKAYIDAAPGEKARQAAKNTSSAVIRNARGLFTPALVKLLGDNIRLPDPIPLGGISTGCTTRRFTSTVDPRALYAEALKDLQGDPLTAFLLSITAGLRRAEVDMLPWLHVDLDRALVHVATTKYFAPKSEESKRSTPIPPDVVVHLRALRAKNPNAEFVLGGIDPAKVEGYRCREWPTLIDWLRGEGLGQNPVHELRKLSGSLVNSVAGLEAARRHLGHRNISTTAASYVTGSAALVNLAAPAVQPSVSEGAK